MFTNINIKRGDIFFLKDAHSSHGSVQKGARPVVVLQNNVGNKESPTTIVAAITSSKSKKDLPVHAPLILKKYYYNHLHLHKSIILMEQIFTINKLDLDMSIGKIGEADLTNEEIKKALCCSLGLSRLKPVITPVISTVLQRNKQKYNYIPK